MSRRWTLDRGRRLSLVRHSPLRMADPRVKLAIGLCVSLAVMLPVERLIAFMAFFMVLLCWARLLDAIVGQIWRLKWVIVVLFLVDWWAVGLDLAITVTLRLVLLAGALTLFFATTTSAELRMALEWLRIPYRYTFSLSLALQSVGMLDDEFRVIKEAQRSRGAWSSPSGWRRTLEQMRDLVALTVPTVVVTARRAWSVTEAAYARGFNSPNRRSYHQLTLRRLDWLLLAATAAIGVLLLFWK